MEGNTGRGTPAAETYLKLLDLITIRNDSLGRDGGGGGERNDLEVAEEQKLELRLGPPGGEDWRVEKEKREDPSVLPLGFLPRSSKFSVNTPAGAKRGFMDTLESNMEGFQQQQSQKPSFLRFASTSGMVNASSQRAHGSNTEQQQRQHQHQHQHQSLEGKAGLPASAISPASESAVASRDSSQARTASAPVVGWPPIRSFRKNLASGSSKPPSQPQNENSGKAERQETCSKGMFVKINMDGILIGRKIDLKAYDSYEKLYSAVDELFRGLLAAQRETPALGSQDSEGPVQAITGLLNGCGEYTLVYEDNEGDVLLVGDVPWNMFVSAVKRLRVQRSSELSVLSLAAINRKKIATEPEVQ